MRPGPGGPPDDTGRPADHRPAGRFAAGRLRPLQSVIIDEGFGSLDRAGLAAMAAELRRLKDCPLIERIVLVSHQEEFADRFPVGYRLDPGDAGTTVTPFRR